MPSKAGQHAVQQHGQSASLEVPQLGSCASSGRAWRLWAARHSQEEAEPLGAQPLPRVLERAASKAIDFTAFDHAGAAAARAAAAGTAAAAAAAAAAAPARRRALQPAGAAAAP
eukprot:scaffold98401_cov21-Phaeocystis_antarctica.AAC.1